MRPIIPLSVAAAKGKKAITVYFVVDTGAPLTMMTANVREAIFGSIPFGLSREIEICGLPTTCVRSEHLSKQFERVNLLGMSFLKRHSISYVAR